MACVYYFLHSDCSPILCTPLFETWPTNVKGKKLGLFGGVGIKAEHQRYNYSVNCGCGQSQTIYICWWEIGAQPGRGGRIKHHSIHLPNYVAVRFYLLSFPDPPRGDDDRAAAAADSDPSPWCGGYTAPAYSIRSY